MGEEEVGNPKYNYKSFVIEVRNLSFLDVINLNKQFEGLKAISELNISVAQGGTIAVIGPNGAGKTTFFNLLTGLLKPTSGEIKFCGQNITGRSPESVAALGIARTFQLTRLFRELTVLENVMVGFHLSAKSSFLSVVSGTRESRREEEAWRVNALELLKSLELEGAADKIASNLPYGQQRIVEIARALATRPKLLLLDEPAAGLNSHETVVLSQTIKKIEESGITILLVEHDVKMVMAVSRHIFVLNYGQNLAEGSPQDIRRNPEVIKAYLGKEYSDANS